MKTNEYIIADTTSLRSFCLTSDSDASANLDRANRHRLSNIETWKSHVSNYPDQELFKEYLADAERVSYEIMTLNAYLDLKKAFYLSKPLIEIDQEEYREQLNVLPPLNWVTIGGVEMFCMSEMYDGNYTAQYAKKGDRYYTKMVDAWDKTTWINNFLK